MRQFLAIALMLWTVTVQTVQAQNGPVVIELFTSQGCSSCPPADALLHKLATRDDVIALSLHVDYWDYIGWKDPFASPEHSERQRAYARNASRRSIYTPQMIIGGVDSVVGSRPMDVADLVSAHRSKRDQVTVGLERKSGRLTVSAETQVPAAYDIILVSFVPERTTKIKRGENAGRTLKYANVVTGMRVLGQWDGRAPLSISTRSEGAVAVLVQHSGVGPVAGAAVALN